MIVVAKLKARSGEESKMADALRAMVSKVEKEEGTLVYTLHQAQNDPAQFLFYEKYADGEALKAHSSTPYFKELFGTLKPLLNGAPEIEMYNELAGLQK
ncbi:MAG: antibiotic biosynthesis monooxygenase [Deltaproteobacteria bacterium]|jgi:quinol monooxygenase YgiN|nr:antibiotic biosynthesis monooxygenase [Deltaproteobacteria bacterium]MBW2480120.1 antibiotic biosynthesis monooxygenase [Deltaproteobacteria bacterium]